MEMEMEKSGKKISTKRNNKDGKEEVKEGEENRKMKK